MRLRSALAALLALILVPAVLLATSGGGGAAPVPAYEEESLAEVEKELNEPADVMLTRQLFGSEKGLLPHIVFRRANRARARIAQATAERAPGIATAEWDFVGPTDIGGRLLDVALDPDDPSTVYAASASGGVWKSTDNGRTLQSTWPEDLTQAIGALVMTPSGVLYAGTGESGPGGGGITYAGDGVYRSDDKGKTWRNVGLQGTSRISRIVVDPTNEKRMFVAATGALFKAGGDRGLYRTDDGGETWKLVLEGETATTGASDIAIDPTNPKRIYATMWDHIREPDRRAYEGIGSGVFRSDDGGDTWQRIGAPSFGPNPAIGRIGIAIAPTNPDKLYAVVTGPVGASGGFWVSTDGGDTWTPRAHHELILAAYTYGWWFGRVWVDPDDENGVYVAGVSLAKTNDGGLNWSAIGGVHADQHGMVWDPRIEGRVWLANDGGLYRSDDDGQTWEFAESQPYSQLWSFDVSEQDPSRLVAGLQDNGVNLSWGEDGWQEYGGGDGERTLIKPNDMETIYGCSQYGACFVNRQGGTGSGGNESFENEVVSTRKNWLTPIEFDPQRPETVYTGGEILSRSEDDAESWTPISPDLTNGPGREINPLFKNYGTITTISPAPRDAGTIYVGTDDGNVQYTHDGGLTWTNAAAVTSEGSLPKAWVTRVQIDPRDTTWKTAYVTYSGFRSGDDAAYVLRTRDGGSTWENVTGDLPRAPVNDINVIGDDLVVASDVGAFLSRDDGRTWLRVGANLPNVPVHELRWHAPTKTLFIATFGRGIYKVDYTAIDKAAVAAVKRRRAKLGLPRRRACGRKLVFKVRKPGRFERATLKVGKRKVVLRRKALRRKVRATLPQRRVRVRISAKNKKGVTLFQVRRYKACPKR